jgi:hypothetical protein
VGVEKIITRQPTSLTNAGLAEAPVERWSTDADFMPQTLASAIARLLRMFWHHSATVLLQLGAAFYRTARA